MKSERRFLCVWNCGAHGQGRGVVARRQVAISREPAERKLNWRAWKNNDNATTTKTTTLSRLVNTKIRSCVAQNKHTLSGQRKNAKTVLSYIHKHYIEEKKTGDPEFVFFLSGRRAKRSVINNVCTEHIHHLISIFFLHYTETGQISCLPHSDIILFLYLLLFF